MTIDNGPHGRAPRVHHLWERVTLVEVHKGSPKPKDGDVVSINESINGSGKVGSYPLYVAGHIRRM